jgi:hypothetical protein
MSHANGLVRFTDGTIRFFEYDGTSDACRPKLWAKYSSIRRHWREKGYWKACTCNQSSETVDAFTDYGNGLSWMTTACRRCEVIVDCSNPYDLGPVRHEVPEWVRELGLTSVSGLKSTDL